MTDPNLKFQETKPDFNIIRQLLKDVFVAILNKIEKAEVPFKYQMIFRQYDDGYGGNFELIPVHSYADDIWKMCGRQPATELLDYIWEFRRIIWKRADSDFLEDRGTWQSNVQRWIIMRPLLVALEQSSIEQLVENKPEKKWFFVDPTLMNDILERIVTQLEALVKGQYKPVYTATFPLETIENSYNKVIELYPGIQIRQLSLKEKSIFGSLHGKWMEWNEPLRLEHILECDLRYAKGELEDGFGRMDSLQEIAANQANLVKWAMMLAADEVEPLWEGTGIITDDFDRYSTHLRRIDVTPRSRYHVPQYKISEREINNCRELISNFLDAAKALPELWDILWYFGRATVASTPRDAFLEAAIGLDALLVKGGENAVYKFRLHGACLLAPFHQGEDIFKELSELYSLRSSAAHGKSRKTQQEKSLRIGRLLAEAIGSVISLYKSKKLTINKKTGLAGSVEDLVKKKVILLDG